MKKKIYAPQYLKVASVDRENFSIRFVFSSNVVDRHGEVIDQKGWILTNYLKNPVVLWGHDQSKFPIGKAANMGFENGNLEGDVIFAYNENPEAAIAFELCAGGFLNAGSVGFMNLKWMYDEPNDIITLLENELFEFSIVNVPANPEAIAKGIEKMESDGVDKKVIESVKAFQAKAKADLSDRFKDLGEEVTPGEEVEEPKKPEGEVEETTATEETTAPVKTEEDGADAEPTEEEVKAALKTLFSAGRETIKASVKELQSRLNDAQEDTKESAVDASPEKDLKKGLSNRHINSLVRSLLSSKA